MIAINKPLPQPTFKKNLPILIKKLTKKLENCSLPNTNYKMINLENFSKKNWFQYFFLKNPINLLFSIDQFLFEFAKKQPQRKKSSEFQQQLKEKKKIMLFYGFLPKKQLSKTVKNALLYQGYFSKNFFSLLEQRLDVILYRSNFAKNIRGAKQLISHKKILVNNKVINIPSYKVNPGDIITINPQYFSQLGNDILKPLKINFKKRHSRLTVSSTFFQKLKSSHENSQIELKTQLRNFIKLLLKKAETRAHLKLQKTQLNPLKAKEDFLFTLLKIKPLISSQAKFNIFSLTQQNHFTIKKKPNIGNFVDVSKTTFWNDRPLLNDKFPVNSHQLSGVNFKKKLFQIALSLNSVNLFNELTLLKFKKYFLKKRSQRQIRKSLRFYGFKPVHLEISYNILTIIYLYSPQRLYFPFFINTDLILRSCS